MQIVGRCDRYRLDVARRQLIKAGCPGTAVRVGQRPSAAFIAIADDGQIAARMRRQRERVIAAPDAGTDDAKLDLPLCNVEASSTGIAPAALP